ncbi:MAG: carboxypeptidase regulatory-like domain-containing protein [Kiritimatiellae bacterium]|nr:carboxypeptidase regulatory-like domain-containing protein [Kiritimatiellia bacterium]
MLGCSWGYSPIIDGATSELEIRVVDDEGTPVADAEVSAVYYTAPEKVEVHRGRTDTNGLFKAKGRTIGEIHVLVEKEGWYQGRVLPDFRLLSVEDATPVHRWAMEEVSVPVRLKRIHSPTHLVVNGGKETWRDMQYPATNAVMGFDLLAYDWCPPFGKGEYADFQIRAEFWRAEDDWFKYRDKVVITMTNAMDGFYLADADPTSAFRYDYEAAPQARFERELHFECDRRSGVPTFRGVPRGKYLVFRTRTVADSNGNVVSAHYGMIQEKMELLGGMMHMRCNFNPLANDVRLEGNWSYRLAPFNKEDYSTP